MSISTTSRRNDYVGDGDTSVYPYNFKIFDQDHLQVYVMDLDGVITQLVRGVGYSVSGVGSRTGGNITLLGGNLTEDFVLVILGAQPLTQTTSIRNQSEYFPATIEDTFDKSRMIDQQLAEALARAVKLPVTIDGFDPTLPTELEADRSLVIGPDGTSFALGPTPEELSDSLDNVIAAQAAQVAAEAAQAAAEAAETDAETAATTAVLAQAGAEDARDTAVQAATDAQAVLATLIGASYYVSDGPFVVNNNSNSDLAGQLFSNATYKQIDFIASVLRGTTVFARDEFTIFYRDGNWELVMGFDRGVNPSGITWTVNPSTGQINAAADNGAGDATIDLKKLHWAA